MTMQAIQTKYLGPTDTKCARITARYQGGKITVSWDYSKDVAENHLAAAWQWVGAGDYPFTHTYQSGDYKTGFKALDCTEDCINNGNLDFMAKHGLTMTTALLRKESKRIAKREAIIDSNVQRAKENLTKIYG